MVAGNRDAAASPGAPAAGAHVACEAYVSVVDCLRTRRVAGRFAVKTPIVTLEEERTGRVGTLVLTAHLGEAGYFEQLAAAIRRAPGQVFFESVRTRDPDPEHWRDPRHRLLRRLRTDVYRELAALGPFAFQGDALVPGEGWVNADVDCCEFAEELGRARVSTLRYELAIDALSGMLKSARTGNRGAARQVELLLRYGLLVIGLPGVFDVLRLLPANNRFQRVAADWRNQVAVAKVMAEGKGDFVLIYGAAHGPGLIALLRERGFRETERRWLTVLRV